MQMPEAGWRPTVGRVPGAIAGVVTLDNSGPLSFVSAEAAPGCGRERRSRSRGSTALVLLAAEHDLPGGLVGLVVGPAAIGQQPHHVQRGAFAHIVDCQQVIAPVIINAAKDHVAGQADEEIFTQVRPKIIAALDEATRKGTTDPHQLQQVVRRAVGGWVGGKLRRRPMIIPVVVEA